MIATNFDSRVIPQAKFLSRGGRKFFFKAIRFEAPDSNLDFQEKIRLSQRFGDLSRAHTTGLIIADRDARPLLEIAGMTGLQVLIELHVPFESLCSSSELRRLSARLSEAVSSLSGHAALMGYLLDFRIEPDVLRHRGIKRIRDRLRRLIQVIRAADPERLVALKHRPATIGLALLEEDLIYAELPSLTPIELQSYVARLHVLAESRPVVLEFGDQLPGQDELVACAFGLGAAGVVAPPMQPAASPGSMGVRALSARELLPFLSLNGSCPPPPAATPLVSVVICACNAERTMRACLESLRRIDYPNYEVIIVDDGSRDSTAQISAEFPEFRLIRQPNKGLSVARNVGMQAARGEIVAYTDSDCVVDRHWLLMLVRTMTEGGFAGCGGPNYAPHEEGWIEACVAASPGAPCHVLTADDQAEHLAGCNMAFRKKILADIGGFDPQFMAAGDDVDICWRLIDAGFSLGFSPSAFVWHFRRNTISAYYGQQRGYGKAEAMLFLKYPDRFNVLGQIRWQGTIAGLARTVPGGGQGRIGWTRGKRAFQPVGEAPLSVARVLPLTIEWNTGALVLLLLSIGLHLSPLPALGALVLGPLWALYYAGRAPLERSHRSLLSRLLIAWLAYTAPISRTLARHRQRKRSRVSGGLDGEPRQRPTIDWRAKIVRLSYWNESGTPREVLLERTQRILAAAGRPSTPATGWSETDLALEPGALTRVEIKTADEEHSGGRLKTHVAIRARLSRLTGAGLILTAIAAVGAGLFAYSAAAAALAILAAGIAMCAASEIVENVRLAYRAVEQCASELSLQPLGAPHARPRAEIVPTPELTQPSSPDSTAF